MLFHIYIQYYPVDGKGKRTESCYEKNLDSLDRIKKYFVKPFNEGATIFASGRVIRPNSINIFRILKSEKTIEEIVTDKNNSIPQGVIMWYSAEDVLANHNPDLIDITNEVMSGEL